MDRAGQALRAVYLATFTALVFAATSIIAVETPATRGFFNLGETMVYTAALLGGPFIGAFTGGLGSALADLYLGYAHYAPGTLVIKGVEGLIVGLVAARARRTRASETQVLGAGMAVALLLAIIGSHYYHGETILSLWGHEYRFGFPDWAWLLVALLFLALLAGLLRLRGVVGALEILGILVGGAEMVLGYFTYQVAVLGYEPRVAALEMPVNLGQALIGLVVSVPLVQAIRAMGVELQVDTSS